MPTRVIVFTAAVICTIRTAAASATIRYFIVKPGSFQKPGVWAYYSRPE